MATILVVDDEPIMLRLCTSILRHGRHEVFEAASGQEALQFLQEQPVELALLDVMMPHMNGIMLAGHIRRLHERTQVLLMSGFGKKEVAEVAGKNNPYRVIWKPFTAKSLLQMIENVLGETGSFGAREP